jgi:hypothetical protein
MQHSAIILKPYCPQYRFLPRRRVTDQRQRRIGVASKDNLRKYCAALQAMLLAFHHQTCVAAPYAAHLGGEPDIGAELDQHPLNIGFGPAGNGAPLRPVGELQQAMIMAESDETLGRKKPYPFDRGGPDGGTHG